MAERLTKRERKAIIAAKMRDPATTTGQLIILNKMYDDLAGKTKRLGRPPKAKEPVVDGAYDERSLTYSKGQLQIDKIQREHAEQRERERAVTTPQNVVAPVRQIERQERQKSPEQLLQELKELQRKAAIAPGDAWNGAYPDVIPRHLRADIDIAG